MSEETSQAAPVKIGKFQASRMIVSESWAILKQDKEMVWFPVISMIFSLAALALLGVAYYYLVLAKQLDRNTTQLVNYAFIFVYYLVIFFIANFFMAGIYIIAQGRFDGKSLTFHDGLAGAGRHWHKIFALSLMSAIVGVILRYIEDKFKLVGRIVAAVLGAAWNILTYFSLPALVIGETSIGDSFRESARVIRKTWGEAIIINFGVGLFFLSVIVLVGVVSAIVIALIGTATGAWVMVSLFIIFLVAISLISSTLGAIFKLALYDYARTGQIPHGFSQELVEGAIKAKK